MFRKELERWASDIQDDPDDGQGEEFGNKGAKNAVKEQRWKSIHDLTQSDFMVSWHVNWI